MRTSGAWPRIERLKKHDETENAAIRTRYETATRQKTLANLELDRTHQEVIGLSGRVLELTRRTDGAGPADRADTASEAADVSVPQCPCLARLARPAARPRRWRRRRRRPRVARATTVGKADDGGASREMIMTTTFRAHDGAVSGMAFSEDGSCFAML